MKSPLLFGDAFCFSAEAPLSLPFQNPAFACGDLPIGCMQKAAPLVHLSDVHRITGSPTNPDFLLPFIRVTCYNGIDCVKKSLNLQKVRKE